MNKRYTSDQLFSATMSATKSRNQPGVTKSVVPKVEICIFNFSFLVGILFIGLNAISQNNRNRCDISNKFAL